MGGLVLCLILVVCYLSSWLEDISMYKNVLVQCARVKMFLVDNGGSDGRIPQKQAIWRLHSFVLLSTANFHSAC